VLQPMRLAHVVAGIAAIVGAVGIGFGIHGFYSLEFIEWAMKAGGAFDNPQYGNISQEAWRVGYRNAMTIFISLGATALVAAYGLVRGRRWAPYVWLAFLVVQLLFMVQGFPGDLASWAWLAASIGIFAFSIFVFRGAKQAKCSTLTTRC